MNGKIRLEAERL